MGALHRGHLDLMVRARKMAGKKGKVVVSIFVNPTQFNQRSDFKKYPHRLAKDSAICRKVGVDLIFAPTAREMYPEDFSTFVEEYRISLPLCGATRPGHFRGVCTVVAKLFNLVQPDVAIFGKKDAQQAAVIQRMVRDLNFPIKIVTAPTVREPDGLAMSSRNERLNPAERSGAPEIYKALRSARQLFSKGERSSSRLKAGIKKSLRKIPGTKLDYVEIVDGQSFESVSRPKSGDIIATAIFVGKTRLIDNVTL